MHYVHRSSNHIDLKHCLMDLKQWYLGIQELSSKLSSDAPSRANRTCAVMHRSSNHYGSESGIWGLVNSAWADLLTVTP